MITSFLCLILFVLGASAMSIGMARRSIALLPSGLFRLGGRLAAVGSLRGSPCHLFPPSVVRLQALSTEASVSAAEPAWSLKHLRKEIARLETKALKIAANAHDQLDRLRSNQSASIPSSSSENGATTIEAAEARVAQASQRLASIRSVEQQLSGVSSVQEPGFQALIPLLKELDISQSPPRAPSRPGSPNQPRKAASPRLPYWVYKSIDGVEIRAGRSAADNDILSCDKAYRDDKHWWMHASGCPGSHVVICYTGDDLTSYPETIRDAAFVAAANSKNSDTGLVSVSLARCRDVHKPKGAKAGLVTLTGTIKSVKIDLRMEKARQERLQRIYS